MQIYLHKRHSGYILGSMDDVFFLPLHPLAIHHIQENFHNMNKVNSAVLVARSRAPVLQQQVEPHERIFYRLFPTLKEVSNLAYSMQKSGQVKDDDWTNIHSQFDSWKENGLVIYFQAYDPNNEDLVKRLFVLVVQSDWMRKSNLLQTWNGQLTVHSRPTNMGYRYMLQCVPITADTVCLFFLCFVQKIIKRVMRQQH